VKWIAADDETIASTFEQKIFPSLPVVISSKRQAAQAQIVN